MNRAKPDVVLCQELVTAIGELREKCRRLDPEFCLASEHSQDRLIPYVDVAYRDCAGYGISALRYVFPEWTSAQHITAPRDFRGVKATGFDGRGNFTFGVKEQIIFPEIDIDKTPRIQGMDITLVTTAKTDAEAKALLAAFGFPFTK